MKWLGTSAIFSPCGTYRYVLTRQMGSGPKTCMFLMLNPSTADAEKNDPTVERCERYALRWGFDSLVVCNLFALRSTDPKTLYTHPDPVGPDNDLHIMSQAKLASRIIGAWGVHGKMMGRDRKVAELIAGFEIQCLGTTKDGHPRHPLYLRSDAAPKPWSLT